MLRNKLFFCECNIYFISTSNHLSKQSSHITLRLIYLPFLYHHQSKLSQFSSYLFLCIDCVSETLASTYGISYAHGHRNLALQCIKFLMQEYLLVFNEPPMFHVSISSSNIMLDENFNAKVNPLFFVLRI